MKKLILIMVLSVSCITLVYAQKPVYLDERVPLEERVQDAISRMTTHEKIRMCHGQSKFTSAGVPRLGIPQLMMSDGPHGVRAEILWNSWSYADWTSDSIVAFPALTCLAATWNPEMSAVYGNVVSEEFAFRGKNIMLGPGLNICRMPLNGRNFEYMGEDPYLAGEMAVPYIQNAQKNGVACCVKHFALNNQEIDRFETSITVDERALNEIYLPAFKKAVQKGGAWTIMGSYPKWNGIHCCQNDTLLNKILKQEWGFDGAVISDWGGVTDTWQAATGGMDIEMGSYTNGMTKESNFGYDDFYLGNAFEKLINEGKIPMNILNDKVARVLRTIFRTSMNRNRSIGSQCSEAHYADCRQIGGEGVVLLQNKGNILPFDAKKYKHILVVGENATRSLTKGGGSSELKTKKDITPLDAIREMYGKNVEYAMGYYSGRTMYDHVDAVPEDTLSQLRSEAIMKAKAADLIIYVGGMNKNTKQDCENSDRDNYNLSYGQDGLIASLAKVCPNIVMVMVSGNAYAMPWKNDVRAILQTWYLGSEFGNTLCDILSGKVNPSGKLPFTFVNRLSDCPAISLGKESYPGVNKHQTYKEGILVGYRWYDTKKVKTLFPFGYGLSYTSFKYGKPQMSSSSLSGNETITLTTTVTNTGKRGGKEVIEMYIGEEQCSVMRPVKELKGFRKIALNPGETKKVSFTISVDDLKYYNEKSRQWVAEPGRFKAYICSSVDDVKSISEFELK
jgi:beta-glucosidase